MHSDERTKDAIAWVDQPRLNDTLNVVLKRVSQIKTIFAQNLEISIWLIMSVPSPAAPNHLLRLHSYPVSALEVSPGNKRIYSGDSSGLVVITSSHTLRAIAQWQAHSDSLLGIEEWGDQIITYANISAHNTLDLYTWWFGSMLQPWTGQ